MDRVTQQNASLVEESAAAAAALEDQAARLNQAVAVFKLKRLAQGMGKGSEKNKLSAPASSALVLSPAPVAADNWESF